jgi:hypothetical protein
MDIMLLDIDIDSVALGRISFGINTAYTRIVGPAATCRPEEEHMGKPGRTRRQQPRRTAVKLLSDTHAFRESYKRA